MASKSRFEWDPGDLDPNLENFPAKVDALVQAITDFQSLQAVSFMRTRAPWHDRTGNARNGLNSRAYHSKNHHEIVIAHGVSYGIWLEVRWSGRYAIISPTIDHIGPQVMAMFNRGFKSFRSA